VHNNFLQSPPEFSPPGLSGVQGVNSNYEKVQLGKPGVGIIKGTAVF
jgi:hypothetical protein